MPQQKKVIITCAITGGVHTPTMSPHLPITPDEIASEAVRAAEAGAAIIHLHARNPETGRPTPDPDVFMRFLPRIKQQTDAVVNITTGGGMGMALEDRLAAAKATSPEMASLNMGSFNFGLFPVAERFQDWRFDWEKGYLEGTKDYIFKNTFKDIEGILKTLGEEKGVKFEFECYDVGHLYNLAHFVDRGLVTPPFFVQTIFGILGGIGADVDNLLHMRRIAQRLFGADYTRHRGWRQGGARRRDKEFAARELGHCWFPVSQLQSWQQYQSIRPGFPGWLDLVADDGSEKGIQLRFRL
jgi:uncharacterized protein (DUF849 family)